MLDILYTYRYTLAHISNQERTGETINKGDNNVDWIVKYDVKVNCRQLETLKCRSYEKRCKNKTTGLSMHPTKIIDK